MKKMKSKKKYDLNKFLLDCVPKIHGHYASIIIKTKTLDEFKEVLRFCDRYNMKWDDDEEPFEYSIEDVYFEYEDGCYVKFSYDPFSRSFEIYPTNTYLYPYPLPFEDAFENLDDFISVFEKYVRQIEELDDFEEED